jgi:predicted small metal-binding protein
MRKIVRCMCGVEFSSTDEADLIAQVTAHAKEAHDLDLNQEQILAMMEIDQSAGIPVRGVR